MENDHRKSGVPLKIVIFHSYVSLPEGNRNVVGVPHRYGTVTKQTNELPPVYPVLSKQCPKNGFIAGLTTLLCADCSETMEAETANHP